MTINYNKVGYIPLHPSISKTGRKTRILQDLNSSSLISLGQLADDGCQSHLNEDKLIVTKENEVVLTGTRICKDGLYDIPTYAPYNHPAAKTIIQPDNFQMTSALSALSRPSTTVFTKPSSLKHTKYNKPKISKLHLT